MKIEVEEGGAVTIRGDAEELSALVLTIEQAEVEGHGEGKLLGSDSVADVHVFLELSAS